jgi:hypothetical protein
MMSKGGLFKKLHVSRLMPGQIPVSPDDSVTAHGSDSTDDHKGEAIKSCGTNA